LTENEVGRAADSGRASEAGISVTRRGRSKRHRTAQRIGIQMEASSAMLIQPLKAIGRAPQAANTVAEIEQRVLDERRGEFLSRAL
jgi:hypothetical protein